MAEAMVLVCDECGSPGAETVTIRAEGKTLQKDYCSTHLQGLLKNARAPRRGRPRKGPVRKAPVKKRVASKARTSKKSRRKAKTRAA